MNGAPTEEIIRVVNLCPTGALSFKWNNEIESENPNSENQKLSKPEKADAYETEVKVMKDGPLVIKGKFIVVGSSGNRLKQMKIISFCRCGQSHNMPYCDGTHRKVGFTAD
jgi:Fe-S-cluster-containing dehydrogenase component